MATLTASAAASGRSPRAVHAGVNSITVRYNSGATTISPSATTIFLAKIPHGAVITEIVDYHTSGAATCPMDIGIEVGSTNSLSAFATAATQGAVTRAALGVPYVVSCSNDAVTQYGIVKGTVTPGTATASVKINLTVFYTMDE